jgi:two-component system response regulator FixJ
MTAGRSVAIVDDDDGVRRSLASLLARAGFEVSPFESGDRFLSAPESGHVSCVVLDLQMPGRDGLAVLRALADRKTSPPVLVMTAHGGIAAAVDAMKLGAVDFLEKPYAPEALLSAVGKAVTTGAKGEEARTLRDAAVQRLQLLSPRHMQVLRGILKGQANKIIAYELGLSIRTVEAYRAEMLERLGVRGTAEAVRLAIAGGVE